MIFRDRVGGGGKEKSAFPMAGRIGWGFELRPWLFPAAIAGEGNAKAPSQAAGSPLSLLEMSAEEAGVGGSCTRVIVDEGSMR